MLGRIAAMASVVALGSCGVVGIRSVEEPSYRVIDRLGAVEIRQYGALVAADAVVPGSEMAARGAGFRKVAGYIFGANRTAEKIAMTAPVAQSPEAGGWRIRFFLPAGSAVPTLPAPNDPGVTLATVPPAQMAVLRFSGSTSPDAVAERADALSTALAASAWKPTGATVAWFYDPPWTLPFLRRNEVATQVERR